MGLGLFSFAVLFSLYAVGANPCDSDATQFCSQLKPGDRRIAHCLKKNHDQISPACLSFALKLREAQKNLRQICYNDIKKYCFEIVPGNDRVYNCLMAEENTSELCKAELKSISTQVQK